MCTHGHPHTSSHRPLKTSSHPAVHIHVSPILTCCIVENPRKWCPVFHLARGRLTTTRTHDVDLIPFSVQRMNMHEVPFCFDSHMNNVAREHLPGSTVSGLRLMRQLPTNLPEYTAKQAPCLPDSYSKQEPNVRTLWPDLKIIVINGPQV